MINKNANGEIEIRTPSRIGPIVGVFFILICIGGYLFYSKPISGEVSVLNDALSAKKTEIEEIKQKLSEFDTAEKELGISTDVERFESLKAIPSEMNQDEVIKDFIEITGTYDIGLKSLSFGKGTSSYEGINSLRINASFEGNYSDLVSFLEGVEQNSRIFKIDTISVQINELDIMDMKRANFSLAIQAFYQKGN